MSNDLFPDTIEMNTTAKIPHKILKLSITLWKTTCFRVLQEFVNIKSWNAVLKAAVESAL